jgi:hypothetical protein
MFRKSWFVALMALVGLLSLVPIDAAAQHVGVVGAGFYAPGWGPSLVWSQMGRALRSGSLHRRGEDQDE